MWGADAEALDALARSFGDASDHLRRIQRSVRAGVHTAPWRGHRADAFRSEWDGAHTRTLLGAADAVEAAAGLLRRNASEQRQATRVAGSAVPAMVLAGAAAGSLRWADSAARSLLGTVDDALGTDPRLDLLTGQLKVSHPLFHGQTGYGADGHARATLGGVALGADGSVLAGGRADGSVDFSLGRDGLDAGMGVSGQYGLAATGGVSAALGAASLAASAGGFVGARGNAGAKVFAGPDGIGGHAGAGAFIGADASGRVGVDVGGVDAGLTGHAMAGLAAEASVDGKVSADEIHIHAKLGLALGVGAGIEPDVTVHPREVISTIGRGLDRLNPLF